MSEWVKTTGTECITVGVELVRDSSGEGKALDATTRVSLLLAKYHACEY